MYSSAVPFTYSSNRSNTAFNTTLGYMYYLGHIHTLLETVKELIVNVLINSNSKITQHLVLFRLLRFLSTLRVFTVALLLSMSLWQWAWSSIHNVSLDAISRSCDVGMTIAHVHNHLGTPSYFSRMVTLLSSVNRLKRFSELVLEQFRRTVPSVNVV